MQSLCTFSDFLHCFFLLKAALTPLLYPWHNHCLCWTPEMPGIQVGTLVLPSPYSPHTKPYHINLSLDLDEMPHLGAWELASWVTAKSWKYKEFPPNGVNIGQWEMRDRSDLSRKIAPTTFLQRTTLKDGFFLQRFQRSHAYQATDLPSTCHIFARLVRKLWPVWWHITCHCLHHFYLISIVSSPSPSLASIFQVKWPHFHPCLWFSCLRGPRLRSQQTKYWSYTVVPLYPWEIRSGSPEDT